MEKPILPSPPHRAAVAASALHDELSSNLVHRSSALFELSKYAVFLGIIVTLVHSLLFTIKIVSGPSMLPNFNDGSAVLVDRQNLDQLKAGDVVVLKYPGDPERHQYIKRIVAVPGDQVAVHNQHVFINNQILLEPYLKPTVVTDPPVAERTLGENEYYTLGDNRAVSNDSRFFGPIERRYIIGRVITTIYNNSAITPTQ